MLLGGLPLAAAALGLAAVVAVQATRASFEGAARESLGSTARQAAVLVEQYVRERRQDLFTMSTLPALRAAAIRADIEARRLRLDRISTDEVEERYAGRTLVADDALTTLLVTYRDSTDFAEIFFTDRLGFVAAATNPTSDFVQSDEVWWQAAASTGTYVGEPAFDASVQTVAFDVAHRIEAPGGGAALGVVKGVVSTAPLARLLTQGSQANRRIEVVDSSGIVLVTADTARLFRPRLRVGAGLVATAPVPGTRWRVEVSDPEGEALAASRTIERMIYLAAGGAFLVIAIVLAWITGWLNRRVTRPVTLAGQVASRVADGDLTVRVASGTGGGAEEVIGLMTSVQTMVGALRRLVGQIRSSSEESAAMAEEISASTEEMSASTQEMADTCQGLTEQATAQARMARDAEDHAKRIRDIARTLAQGAERAASSNATLMETAERHRTELLAGSEELTRLAADLETAAAEAEQLAERSQAIERFVRQARSIASQTNMLALNAAIEASRAGGGEGRGFGVVADEVRKLATQAGRAASSTAETVRDVVASVHRTRDRLAQLAASSEQVRAISSGAAAALGNVAGSAAEASAWTGEISQAASELSRLVEEITGRLTAIAEGTESVVAAAEEIASAAEEQSASTEEIAGSAQQLAEASQKLTAAVSTFRLNGQTARRLDGQTARRSDVPA